MCICCEEGRYVYLDFDECEDCEYALMSKNGEIVEECKRGLMGKDCPEWCDDVEENVK